MDLDSAYRWARGIEDARIGLAGTTAGFPGYGFYGTDLSNRVVYLGEEGPHGAFNAIPTCAAFRAAVNAADLDYLVTSPFLNFIHPGNPVPSPEARWLRGEPRRQPRSCAAARSPSGRSTASSTRRLRPGQRAAARDPRSTPSLAQPVGTADELPARERALPVGGGLARLQALEDPRARRRADRVVDAIREELRRRIGPTFTAAELAELYGAGHRLVPAGGDRRRAGDRGRPAVARRRRLLALPARRHATSPAAASCTV